MAGSSFFTNRVASRLTDKSVTDTIIDRKYYGGHQRTLLGTNFNSDDREPRGGSTPWVLAELWDRNNVRSFYGSALHEYTGAAGFISLLTVSQDEFDFDG